jgi:hypothetical protein
LQTLWQQPARGLGSGRDSCGFVSFQCVSKRTPYLVTSLMDLLMFNVRKFNGDRDA